MTQAKRILLGEDDPRDAELTLIGLSENGLANHVVVVEDGVAVMDYLLRRGRFAERAEGNPVVVLLDVKMPKLDGIQVLRAIRANPQLRLIPVVMLTSSGEQRDLVECYTLGVNAYVVKPVHFEEFQRAVKALGMFWGFINQAPPSAP